MNKTFSFVVVLMLLFFSSRAQSIGSFTSVQPGPQPPDLILPASHTFQYIIEEGDPVAAGGVMPGNFDFTGYVPINGSSANGYLSINSELNPVGGVTVLDVFLDTVLQKWEVTYSEKIDFSSVVGTVRNCSGAVTAWGTVISCEEQVVTTDLNGDGYHDGGWAVEIDPATKTVIDKRWAMGNFRHENAAIHANGRTVYQGVDDDTGYIYKFVADTPQDLSSGALYVYSGSKSGGGSWIPINNTTPVERNTTLEQSDSVGGTVFNGVEDLEIGPDGKIYVAVKNECVVYRFDDSDPVTGLAVSNFETYVGNQSYQINYGSDTVLEPFGCGADNLAFDGEGNLWVLQDAVQSSDNNYIWVVGPGHTQASPDVRVFARTPEGSEPTGITFTPDYKYLFMSIMHPDASNSSTSQADAFGNPRTFDRDVAIVIALHNDLGGNCPPSGTSCDDGDSTTINDVQDGNCNCLGVPMGSTTTCVSVGTGTDDAEEGGSDGSISFASTDLELVTDPGTPSGIQVVGMRFINMDVPQGATIERAFIQFTVQEVDSGPTALTLRGEDTDDAAAFKKSNYNISNRQVTSASVSWNPAAWTTVGANGSNQRTPDLSPVIQEIVDRPGYALNNAIVLIVTGTGKRTATSHDGSAILAPQLCIQFSTNEGCAMTAPTANATNVTSSTVQLEWTHVPDAVGYRLTGGVSGGATATINRPASPPNFSVSNLTPNTSYTWAVQAICNSTGTVLGPPSNTDGFTTLPSCNPPQANFTDMVSNSTARLNWSTVAGALGYRISGNALGAASDLVISVQGGSTAFFNVITLPANTSFQWKVQAICVDGSFSPPTARDTFTTAALKDAGLNREIGKAAASGVSIYPNPSLGIIYIHPRSVDISVVSVELYDATGAQMHRTTISKTGLLFQLSLPGHLREGSYWLKVDAGGQVAFQKVMLIRD